MKDKEPQGIFVIFIIIIYTDKLHAAALDRSFYLPLKKQVRINVDDKEWLVACWCLLLSICHCLFYPGVSHMNILVWTFL